MGAGAETPASTAFRHAHGAHAIGDAANRAAVDGFQATRHAWARRVCAPGSSTPSCSPPRTWPVLALGRGRLGAVQPRAVRPRGASPGRLAPGMLADLVVLDRDPVAARARSCPPGGCWRRCSAASGHASSGRARGLSRVGALIAAAVANLPRVPRWSECSGSQPNPRPHEPLAPPAPAAPTRLSPSARARGPPMGSRGRRFDARTSRHT
jgi:hypothetical protein